MTDPFHTDCDGDGLTDAIERTIGTSLSVSDRPISGPLLQNAALLGYYTQDQIIDVALGQLGLEPVGGSFKLRL